MLRDSLADPCGRNIEQVEIHFTPGVAAGQIITAWDATAAAVDILRMGFLVADGEPVGIQNRAGESSIQVIQDPPESWKSWLARDRLQPLPLDGGLPWRISYVPDLGKLVWTVHHALLDGRSITKILQAFHGFLSGGTGPPAPLRVAFLTPPAPNEITEATAFHRRAFAAVERTLPEFPLDQTGVPARANQRLGAEIAAAIESAARAMAVTAPTLVTWAWAQAVAKSSGAAAVAIGQVRSGPPRHGQAGFSMNTVPVVISRDADPQALRSHLLAMRGIENVSPRDLPSDVFQNAGGPWPGGILMVERGTLHHQVGLSPEISGMILHEHSGEPLLASAWIHPSLDLEVETNGHPFGPLAATCLLDLWADVLKSIAINPAGIDRLPESMERQLDSWENGGEPIANRHVSCMWGEISAKFASQPALWTPARQLTFSELSVRVDHLAALLHNAGAKPGTPVASLLQDRAHLAETLLAIARIDGTHVPLDPVLPHRRHRDILDDACPAVVITDDPASCPDFGLPVVNLHGESEQMPPVGISGDPARTLALLYTSGSTGMPKGVMMTHGGVINEALAMAGLAGMAPGDRLLQFASPGFDASLEEILATLLSGSTLVPRPAEITSDFALFHQFLQTAEITVLDLTTAFWAAWCAWMVSQDLTIPEKIRVAMIGGERLSAAAARDWGNAGGNTRQLINSYGPTEASVVATTETVTRDWTAAHNPPIGSPLPGVIARVADPEGRRLPPGAAGELWLGGLCVSPGYWRKPEQTAAAFLTIEDTRWYRTGDHVHWDADGRLRFLGRRDDQLKIRGHRVEPGEIIRVLESHPGVVAAHAGPVTHNGTVQLAAWLRWAAPPDDGWVAQVAAFAAERLPTAAIPTRWAAVDAFALTERGKLDRHALPTPELTASASSGPPATPTERRIVEFWQELLGVTAIGRDDSFFDLGGHSIAALQLFAKISREWKIRIPMAALIQAPTPRLLGAVVDRGLADPGAAAHARPVVVPVRAEGSLQPLFCIHGGDGGVIFYQNLAAQLPPGRPVLAIESPALGADEEVRVVPVEESAATYIEALRRHQPEGPFHLVGYSYGGLLVYEMARQLIAAGETVAFAGLFDTINPAAPTREYSLLERAEVFWNEERDQHWLSRVGRFVNRIREGIATNLRVKGEIRAARTAGNTEPHSDIRALQVREAHWQAMTIYQPMELDCHITLFKTQSADDKFELPHDYGWSRIAKTLEIVEVPGQHLTMFSTRYVGTLARQVARRL